MSLPRFEIPLQGRNQQFSIALNGVPYILRFLYNDTQDPDTSSWILDIKDSSGKPLVCGVPLVTGEDLLVQYKHLGINIVLFCFTDGDVYAIPTFDNLGSTSHLLFETLT